MKLKIIAKVRSDFPSKFGVPRQSGLVEELKARVVFEPEYRDEASVRGLEQFSHIWLIWQFSENLRDGYKPTVRPPRLGGNTRVGVFATRSPFRPNEIGLSSVKLEKIEYTKEEGPVLHISGADLIDNTPIFDIKPYLPFSDSHPEAKGGFAEEKKGDNLKVEVSKELLNKLPSEKREALIKLIENDPRPAYHNDQDRVYGFSYAGFEIKFKVTEDTAFVTDIEKEQEEKL